MTALYSTNQNFNQKCNIEKIQDMYLVNLPCTHGTTWHARIFVCYYSMSEVWCSATRTIMPLLASNTESTSFLPTLSLPACFCCLCSLIASRLNIFSQITRLSAVSRWWDVLESNLKVWLWRGRNTPNRFLSTSAVLLLSDAATDIMHSEPAFMTCVIFDISNTSSKTQLLIVVVVKTWLQNFLSHDSDMICQGFLNKIILGWKIAPDLTMILCL